MLHGCEASSAASVLQCADAHRILSRPALQQSGCQDSLSPNKNLPGIDRTYMQGVARAPAVVPAQAQPAEDAVTAVATPAQLQNAIQQGARHIEITAHMDLTSLDAAPNPGDILLGYFSDTTRSIKVCPAPVASRMLSSHACSLADRLPLPTMRSRPLCERCK